ncbi:MAG: hypothetical protein NC453_17170 [Muribaculum sp.]|nr:hypothetical protein [Muribaculum sp.]
MNTPCDRLRAEAVTTNIVPPRSQQPLAANIGVGYNKEADFAHHIDNTAIKEWGILQTTEMQNAATAKNCTIIR